MSSTGLKSVFFTGAPLDVGERMLRRMFAEAGHVVAFRLLPLHPARDFQSGFVDYLDSKSAEDAIARFDGHMFGEMKMKVSNAATRKRTRQGDQQEQQAQAPAATTQSTGPLLEFRKGFRNLFVPGETLIESALRKMPIADAYEAVEQLRIMVLERPEEARELLELNPQLCIAVVMILQHAGKVPTHHLPEDAVILNQAPPTERFRRYGPRGGAAANEVAVPAQVVEEVMKIVQGMQEDEVETIVNMTPEQLASIPDEHERQQVAYLQRQLKRMQEM